MTFKTPPGINEANKVERQFKCKRLLDATNEKYNKENSLFHFATTLSGNQKPGFFSQKFPLTKRVGVAAMAITFKTNL